MGRSLWLSTTVVHGLDPHPHPSRLCFICQGLANAEEEVHSLKATVLEVEAQRDHYKGLLAKTNSELETSQAYAQMSKVIGHEAGASFMATTTSSGGVAAGADDAVIKKRSGTRGSESGRGAKGKAPAAQVPQEMAGVVATSTSLPASGSGSSSLGDSPIATEAAAPGGGNQNHEEAPIGATAGNTKKGKGRTTAAEEASATAAARGQRSGIAVQGAATLGKADKTASTTTATAANSKTSRRKRQREEGAATAGDYDEKGVDEGRRRENKDEGQERQRSRGEKKSGTQRGVEVPLLEPGVLAGPLWSGEGEGEVISEAGDGGGGGGGGEAGGGEGDVQSVYDSDDAPSMFF